MGLDIQSLLGVPVPAKKIYENAFLRSFFKFGDAWNFNSIWRIFSFDIKIYNS